MRNKTKYTIFTVISYLLMVFMFFPFVFVHIYRRKTGLKFQYDILVMVGGILTSLFLIWVASKLLGVNHAFTYKNTVKPNWVNFLLSFIRIFALSIANTTSDSTALYARLGTMDKNTAIQKIYLIWSIVFAIVLISGVIEEKYNKKRETTNEN